MRFELSSLHLRPFTCTYLLGPWGKGLLPALGMKPAKNRGPQVWTSQSAGRCQPGTTVYGDEKVGTAPSTPPGFPLRKQGVPLSSPRSGHPGSAPTLQRDLLDLLTATGLSPLCTFYRETLPIKPNIKKQSKREARPGAQKHSCWTVSERCRCWWHRRQRQCGCQGGADRVS